MDSRQALRILLETADLESDQKQNLLAHLNELTEESVMELGRALAEHRRAQAFAANRATHAIDEVLAGQE